MTKGFRTTEFWVTILTIIGSSTAAVSNLLSPQWAALLIGISTLAYNISRGLAKGGKETPIELIKE